MAKTLQLAAKARAGAGKGAARAVRRDGRVPAVVYGDGQSPQLITLDYLELWKQVHTGRFLSSLVDIDVDGKKIRAIPREVQHDPVRDFLVHVDFLRLGKGARIRVQVPVHFHNHEASPGLKRGGVLNIVRHEIELYCSADAIPDGIEIDLTGRNIGDSIHVSHVALPPGTSPTIADRDFTIATVAGAVGLKEEAEKPEAVEGEVAAATPEGGAAA